jgi:hypothetical protein
VTRVKALLRRWFAALVDDEYQRVTKDNVVLRNELDRHRMIAGGAAMDAREATRERMRAEKCAQDAEAALVEAEGKHARVMRQRDLVIAERDAMRDRLIELGEVMVEVPEHERSTGA